MRPALRTAATFFLGALRAGTAAADDKPVPLVLRLSDQANTIWSALPEGAADPRLSRVGEATDACVNTALGEARRLLGREPGARMALREVSLPLTVPRSVADRLARGETAPALFAPHVTPATRGDHVVQPLGDESCGAYYEMRGAGAPGRLALGLRLEAGCGCTGDVRLQLLAEAPLTPSLMEKKNVLRLSAGEARYEVMAACEPCERAANPAAAARTALPGGPCDNLCAPLAQGLAAWQRKATDAASRLEDLLGKATTLQLQVSSDRKELAGAESARSKPRAVMEKISALQARIKSAEAELARVRQASQDVERTLSALRRITGDTEGAEGRCRAQCQARPPRQQKAQAESGSGGASASGGGVSTGVLIAGGAALAAGGAVALASGGSDSDPDEPTGPLDISGLWSGTLVVTTNGGPPNGCRRTFAEDWQISQNGTALDVAVALVITDCGTPNCSSGCVNGAQGGRRYTGTLSGSTANLYPYPGLQQPECVLPMVVQGSTMRGTMPACGTQAIDATMQRVTR